jgi:AhpD family alkylhydroperoxidase
MEEYSEATLKSGVLTKKEKEIIAVAVAHATGSLKSIEFHTQKAKVEGVSLEELIEATYVAAALEAGGVVTHSTNMQNALSEEAEDTLYLRSNLKKLGNLRRLAPDGFVAYRNFSAEAMKEGALRVKLKELIAVAVAHITECPYCIDVHSRNAQKAGATEEELAEAIMVAASLASSKVVNQIDTMVQIYEE